MSAEYLCQSGISEYNKGRYESALSEFSKVLIVEPQNQIAKNYIREIFNKELVPAKQIPKPRSIREDIINETLDRQTLKPQAAREDIINDTMMQLGTGQSFKEKAAQFSEKKNLKIAGIAITGNAQLSGGFTPDDAIWKRANADLNEENYRILSTTAFDQKTNTYDPRIYDRVNVNLDTDNAEGINFHGNLMVDPWSFTGKSSKFTVTSLFGDTAEVELKYWSNTGYTIGQKIYSTRLGNVFSLPEVKVEDGATDPFSVNGAFSPFDRFSIPGQKINMQFQPLREIWADYTTDNAKVKVFPMAYENQAYTSDDPLKLSNNRIYWQQSPWIDSWLPGRININGGGYPSDFTRGKFDDSLSYLTRDSDGTRLTALRGLSLDVSPLENLSIASTFATPKTLWQDYDSFDNLINATRVKFQLLDNLSLGSLFTYRMGLNTNKQRDFENYVWGFDVGYEILEGVKVAMEAATSKTRQDISFPQFKTEHNGNAYNFTLMGTLPGKPIMDLKYGYNDIKPEKDQNFFAKYRFYVARMDKGFNPSLSDYRDTRDDTYWSRHIHFRNAYDYFISGINEAPVSWNDIDPYRIGNGIDIGRDVFGLRLETSLLNKNIYNLFDVRNVHRTTNGKFIENVARDELTYQITNKLSSKFLGIYHRLPKTTAGLDPFIFDTVTDLPVTNAAILDGKNPTLKTGSMGLEYAFTDWIALSGIWERTNDSTLAYDNFPRGVLNNASLGTFAENGQIFRQDSPYLYSQGLFPLPPYSFYNIWKTALKVNPIEKMQVYLDYTRNEFKSAGQIDNNINHVGMEVAYTPVKKIGIFFRYTYSRWNDISRMLTGYDKIYLGHHNFFTEFRYLPSDDDELTFQYGESGISPIATTTYDPFGGSIATLDTRHIIRIYYRRKF